ncbi:inner membrane protein [Cutibacterium acnes JCM 18920]|nr:inner membrane protein [Cutibacterium acnes JCM 18920]
MQPAVPPCSRWQADAYLGRTLVHDDVDAAIRGIGRLGTEGMKQTDPEILSLMMAKQTV